MNGFKFRTLEHEQGLTKQNCGVFGMFGTISYLSSRDGDICFSGMAYYGKLVDIIELNHQGRFTVTLFKCK